MSERIFLKEVLGQKIYVQPDDGMFVCDMPNGPWKASHLGYIEGQIKRLAASDGIVSTRVLVKRDGSYTIGTIESFDASNGQVELFGQVFEKSLYAYDCRRLPEDGSDNATFLDLTDRRAKALDTVKSIEVMRHELWDSLPPLIKGEE